MASLESTLKITLSEETKATLVQFNKDIATLQALLEQRMREIVREELYKLDASFLREVWEKGEGER